MMAPRFIAAALGLLAFSGSVVAGMLAGNPVAVVLSRSIWAMVLFAVIGLLVGSAASVVVREHVAQGEAAACESEDQATDDKDRFPEQKSSIDEGPEPMGT